MRKSLTNSEGRMVTKRYPILGKACQHWEPSCPELITIRRKSHLTIGIVASNAYNMAKPRGPAPYARRCKKNPSRVPRKSGSPAKGIEQLACLKTQHTERLTTIGITSFAARFRSDGPSSRPTKDLTYSCAGQCRAVRPRRSSVCSAPQSSPWL